MSKFVIIVGYLCLLACAVALAALFVMGVIWAINERDERFFRKYYSAVSADVRNNMAMNACWFSESPEAMIALKVYARSRTSDMNHIRDEWRARVEQDGKWREIEAAQAGEVK